MAWVILFGVNKIWLPAESCKITLSIGAAQWWFQWDKLIICRVTVCFGKCISMAPATKNASHLSKELRLSRRTTLTHYETCCDVKKCHACHMKRVCATFETSKSDLFCSPIGPAIVQSSGIVADDRKRFRNVRRTRPQPPTPQGETGTLAMHSRKTRT